MHCLVSPPWSAHQQRHLSYLAEFTSSIIHVPGPENVVTDAHSRPSSGSTATGAVPPRLAAGSSPACSCVPSEVSEVSENVAVSGMSTLVPALGGVRKLSALVPAPGGVQMEALVQGFDISKLPQLQASCPSIADMTTSGSLNIVSVPLNGQMLLCDNSTGALRPLVPAQLRRELFNKLHELTHPGVRATKRLISTRFVWSGLARDVTLWTRSCLRCQQSKIQTHVHSPISAIPVPTRRFSHVHIDIVGPLPSSQGFSYLLTMIDRTSRWPEVTPLESISTESCVRAFISTWISRFGVPATLTSDRGTQFTSSVWAGVCSTLGISPSTTTSFHPQSNGMIERFHRTLKNALRARLASSEWYRHLPMVLLGLRTTPRDDTALSASEAVYGAPLTVPGEFLGSPELPPPTYLRKIEEAISGFAVPPPHHVPVSPPNQLPLALQTCKFVFIREDSSTPSLSPLYRGPYLVPERRDKFFRLQIGSKSDAVSVDRLKPAFSADPIKPALLPVRGRPPRLVPPPSAPPPAPPSVPPPAPPSVPPSVPPPEKKKKKSVIFNLKPLPAVPVRRNPPREVRRKPSSALSPLFLLGGLLWRL